MLEDGALDWAQPVASVFARYRGVTPEPGAHTTIAGDRLKILVAAPATDAPPLAPGEILGTRTAVLIGAGDGALEVTRVQPAGKGPMNAADWWRGLRAENTVRAGS
ncbi:hypothetical protein GCM10025863_08940 [Microbacterium suwonense]|uniref:Methionyl-tRNA formyltransferase n=2 Tax=Microbacterium suwonense TaxID=683047 RepID=A0ABN6X248_9MICO|nr:hypothetical protein GCM10025863_08940 [Microbacterium suwonense]